MRSVLCTSSSGSKGRRGGSSLRLKCCVLRVVPRVCPQKAVGLAAAGQAAEVCDGHGHFGTGDSVVVRCGPPRFKVHPKVPHRHVIDKRVGQRHLESLGRTLAVLVDAHASELAEVRVVEARVQHVQAVSVRAVGGKTQGLLVVHGPAVQTLQRRKAVRVQTADLCRTAHCGDGVTQRCNRQMIQLG